MSPSVTVNQPTRPARFILFDIDGTLIRTGGAGCRALTRAFEDLYGIPRALDGVPLAGRTDPLIVAGVLAAAGHATVDHAEGLEAFRQRYYGFLVEELGEGLEHQRVLPGVVPLLERLGAGVGNVMTLLTGNYAEGARIKLEHFGLWQHFGWGAFGEDAADRNGLVAVALERAAERGWPVGASGRTIVVGDTPLDIACARAAGVRSIAVATGDYGVDALGEAGADVIFETLADTEAVLDALDGEGRPDAWTPAGAITS